LDSYLFSFFHSSRHLPHLHSFPTRRSSDLSSRWVAEGLTDKEIAKRTPKQSTLPVPPVIPPGEPRGGLLFPLTYELISTKYLLCVPNTTRLPLRSSKS